MIYILLTISMSHPLQRLNHYLPSTNQSPGFLQQHWSGNAGYRIGKDALNPFLSVGMGWSSPTLDSLVLSLCSPTFGLVVTLFNPKKPLFTKSSQVLRKSSSSVFTFLLLYLHLGQVPLGDFWTAECALDSGTALTHAGRSQCTSPSAVC